MTVAISTAIDLDRLFRLRLVVGRFGEMDVARWWNSKGMLGRHGAVVLKRGFPATHYFVQARVVFAVARGRSQELFNPPGCLTLWSLPSEIEDTFEECWQTWLDESDRWAPLFESLASIKGGDLIEIMTDFDLLSEAQCDAVAKLRRSAEGRSVPLPGTHAIGDEVLTLLAAGFTRGEVGNPAIPYARMEG